MNSLVKLLISAQITLLTASCNHQTSISEAGTKTHELTAIRSDIGFDSCMALLIDKYKYPDFFRPIKGSTYHEAYTLRTSIYIPAFKNLTFEYRQLGQISEAFSPVVYLHNDSTNFVLSFLDLQYYKWSDIDSSKTLAKGDNLHFESEINSLTKVLNINSKAELIILLDILMDFFNANRIVDEIDAKYFSARGEDFMLNGKNRNSCNASIKETIQKVNQTFMNPNQLIYSNGVITFIISITDNFELQSSILNTACLY